MTRPSYKLSYLPLFHTDLANITDYIAHTLNNSSAALRLLDDVESAIMTRLKRPLSHTPVPNQENRPTPYYSITVRNYTVFYVVIGDVMEVRRILHNRRNFPGLLP